MSTATMTTATRADQEAEAAARQSSDAISEQAPAQATDDPNPASNPPADDAPARQHDAAEHGDGEAPPRKFISPGDEARQRAAERFKAQRAAHDQPDGFNGDFRDPAMVYGRVAAPEPEAEPPAPPPLPPGAEDRRIKLKVRHGEREYTDGEVIALAQKAAAGEDYFDESKRILNEAKALREAAARPHQGGDDHAYADPDAPPEPSPHQADEIETLVETIQYGDPKEGANKLRLAIESGVGDAVTKSILTRQMRDDYDRSVRSATKFKDEHPELASDPIADAAITRLTVDAFREDLTRLGLAADRLPRTPNELADWHRFYRVQGHEVRDFATILREARDHFLSYKSGTSAKPAEPKIHVNLDRESRRQNIPTQPQRAAAAPATRNAPQTSDVDRRKAAIRRMKQSRGQVTA